jgi:DNA gyrase/topoisomerase IV subunit B
MEHKIYENEEIKNMFTALGVKIGTVDDHKALDTSRNCVTTKSLLCVMPMWMDRILLL